MDKEKLWEKKRKSCQEVEKWNQLIRAIEREPDYSIIFQ